MNRRGQVPILLLFIVALVLCVYAGMSFFGFDRNFGETSNEYNDVISEVNFAENYVYVEANLIGIDSIKECGDCTNGELKDKFMEIASEKDLEYPGAGNFFGKIRSGDFDFYLEGEQYVLEVSDLFVKSEFGRSEIKRNFDLVLELEK